MQDILHVCALLIPLDESTKTRQHDQRENQNDAQPDDDFHIYILQQKCPGINLQREERG